MDRQMWGQLQEDAWVFLTARLELSECSQSVEVSVPYLLDVSRAGGSGNLLLWAETVFLSVAEGKKPGTHPVPPGEHLYSHSCIIETLKHFRTVHSTVALKCPLVHLNTISGDPRFSPLQKPES